MVKKGDMSPSDAIVAMRAFLETDVVEKMCEGCKKFQGETSVQPRHPDCIKVCIMRKHLNGFVEAMLHKFSDVMIEDPTLLHGFGDNIALLRALIA